MAVDEKTWVSALGHDCYGLSVSFELRIVSLTKIVFADRDRPSASLYPWYQASACHESSQPAPCGPSPAELLCAPQVPGVDRSVQDLPQEQM